MKQKITAFAFIFLLAVFLPVRAFAAGLLVPGGQLIALELQDDTVAVAAFDEELGQNAKSAGLRVGDVIEAINGQAVTCAQDVKDALSGCGQQVRLAIIRGKHHQTITLRPCQTGDGPKLGIYLRQGIAGVGTVSFYDPESRRFGTLGHGVSDSGGRILQMTGGQAWDAQILSVKKGAAGDPGQLRGSAGAHSIGTLYRNTAQGVFGTCTLPVPGDPLPTADYADVSTGPAAIRCTVGTGGVQEYSVEILKIYPENCSDSRNFLLRVTDPELLAATGGIVQGMSGSPIIQDGKLIGAVTHVLVNDPKTGYGIFIENMLEAAS